MKEITKEEYENALAIVEGFKYQNDKTVQASVVYNAKVYVTVNVPNNLSIDRAIDELRYDYYDFKLADVAETVLTGINELILDGYEIDLYKSENDIIFQEFKNDNGDILAKFEYKGDDDPVRKLDSAIHKYIGNCACNEFVDSSVENNRIRFVVKYDH